jgi:glycosyltransferase involved in cell wall biosynthesis
LRPPKSEGPGAKPTGLALPDFASLDRYLRLRVPGARAAAFPALMRCVPAGLLAAREVAADPADILLLHPHASAIARHERLAASLAQRGLSVRHEFVPRFPELLLRRRLRRPDGGWAPFPPRWRAHAGYAAWLMARYRPRVVVTFMDDSLHSPFLRDAAAAAGAVTVNVAHSMSGPNLDFSMCDVDWYLLWGRRSFANLAGAPVRYGTCRTLAIGSIYQAGGARAAERALPAGRPARLLWIGQDFGSEHGELLRRDAAAFARFMASHPQYEAVIRAHPRDRGELERVIAPLLPLARWTGATALLPEVLEGADIAASSFSSGLVDAAAAGLPVIAFSSCALVGAIGLADFGLPVVADEAALAAGVEAILADYGAASRSALALAREHLFDLGSATEHCARVLETLARGGDPAGLGFPEGVLEHRLP